MGMRCTAIQQAGVRKDPKCQGSHHVAASLSVQTKDEPECEFKGEK